MELSDLHIFTTVVRAGGVTRAAERLHRVQSSVSKRIRQLEQDLGVALFVREGKRLQLAPAGQLLLDYADRLLAMADEARNAVQDTRPRGVLRVGALESTAAVRLPAHLSAYHRSYPDVSLELRTGYPRRLAAEVLAGELDAALVAEPIADGPFDKQPAFVEELVIVGPAGHAPIGKAGSVPPTMIALGNECPLRSRLAEWYAKRGETVDRTIELGSYQAILACVAEGMGIALVPKSVLRTFPERRRLSVHALPSHENWASIVLIWRKGATSPKLQALKQVLHGTGRAPRQISGERNAT